MAVKGKEKRNKTLEKLLRFLWAGAQTISVRKIIKFSRMAGITEGIEDSFGEESPEGGEDSSGEETSEGTEDF